MNDEKQQTSSEFELDHDSHRLRLRNLEPSDYAQLKELMDRVYPDLGGSWLEPQFRAQLERFAEGQICIEDDGKVVAAALAVIVDYDRFTRSHTYKDVIGKRFDSHDPSGDALYGIDVFVDPDYRDMRLGRRLYDARKDLCRHLNLRAIVTGGRIPRYLEHSKELSPHEYIERVKRREIYDPILTFQLSNDFQVRRVLKNYIPEDKRSEGHATLLEWTNIYYEEKTPSIWAEPKQVVRIGAVQWQMRPTRSLEQLVEQVEFFVNAVADYQADFVMFPEFFNAPLMGQTPEDKPLEAVHELAKLTPAIVDAMSRLAVSYNINIVAGSMPMLEDGRLYNVAWLCRRDGTSDSQAKLHITPDEQKYWALEGGAQLRCFETDVGKVGILICYDVEFPELARILADRGMQILFVPFWTDTRTSYLRVRRCAQARAIENECYVAISGSVGNLPRVENAEIQYAQSAVFSPSDFAFPHDSILAETTPNTEMTIISDLDLSLLKRLREEGSVRNMKDRRHDLYQLRWLGQR